MELMSHLQLIVAGSAVFVTIGLTLLKLLDSRFNKNERLAEERDVRTTEAILALSKSVAEASGSNVTMTDCVVNSRRAEDKWEKAVAEAEVRTDAKILPLEKRIDKLEAKIF